MTPLTIWNGGDGDGEPSIEVRISRRNLLALLVKLDLQPGSSCTLVKPCGPIDVIIRADPDETHRPYQDRPPGPMQPETEDYAKLWERFVAQTRGVLDDG